MLDLLRRYRDFRFLFIATVVNLCGDWFATVALIGRVTDLGRGTWLTATMAASLVFVCQMLPSFVVTPFAGPLADRLDRRTIMITVSVLQCGAALLFLLVDRSTLWLAFAAQIVVSTLAGFFSPASQASVANLVSKDDLPRAAGLLGTTWGAMLAIGATLGAFFSSRFGRNAAFVADSVSFALAALALSRIRGATSTALAGGAVRPKMRPIADTRDALARARQDPPLFYLLFSKAGFGLASGVVGLLTALGTTRFHGGDRAVGLLLGARGVGVVFGPVVASRLGSRTDVAGILRASALSCIAYGIAYAGVARSGSLALACVLGGVAHLGGGAQWTLSTYGLQANTPDEYRGRIMSADFALVSLSMSTSFLVAGWLGRRFGASTAFSVLAAVAVLWGLLYLRVTARLRGTVVGAG